MKKLFDLLKLTDEEKDHGVWLSGVEYEGEYKEWGEDGKILYVHSNWKDGFREGEFKSWHGNGQLWEHSYWEKGELHGEKRKWGEDGQLVIHDLWGKGKLIKDYLYD